VVIGIKGLRAQSDRMLSIGDGRTDIGVPRVCPKKEKNARSPDGIVGWENRWSPELADGGWMNQRWHEGQEMGGGRNNEAPGPVRWNAVHR
jgi:hypothetical protein